VYDDPLARTSPRRTAFAVAIAVAACTPHGPRPDTAARTDDAPPPTRRDDLVEELHGTPVADPYRWLERIEDPEVAAWTTAQDRHARRELAALPGRDALRERILALTDLDTRSAPRRFGERLFWTAQRAGQDKAVYWVREPDGRERVLLDPHAMGGAVSIHGVFPSHDGRVVAYKISHNNADAASLRILDVDALHDREVIDGARYALPSWTPDGRGFYYTALPTDPSIPAPELPGHAAVKFHRIGTDARDDALVFPATGDPTRFVGAQLSHDGRYLVVTVSRGFSAQDVYFADLRAVADLELPTLRFETLTEGRPYHTAVVVHDGRFYVHTNDGAPRFRVMLVDPASPERDAWREVVPEGAATLQGIDVIGGLLELVWLERASSRIELRTLAGAHVRDLPLPGLGTASGLVGEPDDDEAYFGVSSFTVPSQIYRTNVATGETTLWHAVELPADTSRFVTEQVEVRSKDGTPVSMFVVHRDDISLDGENRALLTGYGGFGVSLTPAFSSQAVLWLEQGGVWAMPNLRGGGEYGEDWHEAGRRHNKQNVFDDFIASAQWLVDHGYTRPGKLAIRGGSNGGLLVGAVSTQRPELFGAVVCAVPLLDMVRYHRFGAGPTWISEYGSPEVAEDFRTLFAYSPYHRVRHDATYPPLLMLSADSDDRVDPMHARKYVAAMQANGTPALLRVERNAGHGGADSRLSAAEQATDVFAFLDATLER
jgi:prolyl oligopeptidase